ncbi:MAG: DNA polymerase III subunit gamma/tau [Firmicutes bacterium]|nr:DNA polymerase III subunit gamma/tau [Bacillota bacterium]
MEHLALYRKWRPQNFKTIIGQDDNVRVLKNAVVSGRTTHAYLFCGTRGTGKTSTARILAKALNCEHSVDGEPCNECENCRAITAGSFMDVIEIDAASNRGIDEVRDLLEKVHFVPVKGKYKVYIIDEAHMLTTEAFNALLKTFEEPPAHVVFILATTEARKVPLTILSRCQRYDFKPINEKTLIDALSAIAKAENVAAEEDAIALLAEKAKGSMRDALSLMDQAMGTEMIMTAAELNRLTGSVPYEFWPDFFRSIAANDLPAVFAAIDGIEEEGKDLRQFFRDFRDCAGDLISAASLGGESRYQQILKQCASLFTPAQILEILTVCGESEIVFRYNRDGKAVCRFLMARIMRALYPTAPVVATVQVQPAAPVKRELPKTVSAPKSDFVFPNETAEGYGKADTVAKAKPQASKKEPIPDDLPPWETMPNLDDLIPPPLEGEEDVYFPEEPPKEAPQKEPVVIVPDLNFDLPAEPKAEESKTPPKKAEPKVETPKYEAPMAMPAEAPEPVSAPAPQKETSGETELTDEDEARWASVLKEVKAQSPSTLTWLNHGDLTAVKDDTVIVSYAPSNGLFMDKVKKPEHVAVIEGVLENIFGRKMRFVPQTAAEKQVEELSLF